MRISSMRISSLLATCAVLAAMPSVARGELVSASAIADASVTTSGYGNAPRLLTLSSAGSFTVVQGSVAPPNNALTGMAVAGANQSVTRTFSTLGWDSGANVAVALVPNVGPFGLTVNSLTMSIFPSSTSPSNSAIATFSLTAPITFSPAASAAAESGSQAFVFALTGPGPGSEQQAFDNILAMNGSSSFVVGLAANLGCSATPSATCQPQSGGPEGFIGAPLSSLDIAGPTNPDIVMPPIAQPAEIPLPASFPLFASGLVGVGLLGWRRQRKSTSSIL
jgi:hypothetical protein